MDHKLKTLSVIIVNYNTGKYAVECIHSVLRQKHIQVEVVVVDNASQDDSVDLLTGEFGSKVCITTSKENLGFGRANNLAASKATGEFLLLLNPDAVILSPFALSNLVKFLSVHPEMGMVGPAIKESLKDRNILPRYTYPSTKHIKYTNTFKNLPGKIAWILGACMLVRRDLYNQICGFDPDYFLYGEDADICLRIRKQGYEIGYCEEVSIEHVSGASEIGASSFDKWLRKKRGVFLFITKHFDRRDAVSFLKTTAIKARCYLTMLKIKGLLLGKSSLAYMDRVNRLRATTIAAEEALEKL